MPTRRARRRTRRLRYAAVGLAAALWIGASPPSGAALVEDDLFASGDGLITLDTDTGLEWLDVDATLGLSYDDIVLGGAGGYTAEGFRFASTPEVATLWANAGIVDTDGNFVAANRTGADLLLSLMGCTFNCGTGDDGAQGQAEFDPVQEELNGPFFQIRGDGTARALIDPGFSQARDFSSSTLGNYLVRPIPEPRTALLVGLGLLALALADRSRRRARAQG